MADLILLIDGANFAWRANIVFKPKKELAPPKEDSNGSSTPYKLRENPTPKPPFEQYVMVYNFFRNLRATVDQFKPTKVFFVLEGHPQFRYDLYADYKANRIIKTGSASESHERFDRSMPDILRLIKHLPITTAKAEHYEADDTIATLAENMAGEEVVIVSNDSDYIQLLQKGYKTVKVYNPMRKEFRVAPDYVFLVKRCLAGDKSDNIPSLMGEKKAIKLASSPKLLMEFLAVEENRAKFSMNRKLVEFAPVPLNDICMEDGIKDFDLLEKEFKKMEFSSIFDGDYWNKFCNTFNKLAY